MPPRMKNLYKAETVPAMIKEFSYSNPMEVPRLVKVSLNIGLGEATQNARALDGATGDLATITGQRPVITRAKRSIAQFRLRAGMPIGAMVTLRGDRMYYFLDKLINATLPRIRDFRGVQRDAFDGRGNYNLGMREQIIFPDIEYDKVDKIRGMEIAIVTSAKTDEEARRLLELLGMPFTKT
ncbi:MAG: 50S ribosomal protein L5 [Dehalococcoidia bacterium]|nr:50S ribosomal protein L5 [Dehalococcoidia bacterium]